MQIVVNSLLTEYEKIGSGDVVLLLHGWGDTHATFNDLQKRLSDRFTLLSLDLPGFGKTQAPDGVWGLDDYAGFIESFLKKLQISKTTAIIAHSNGGSLAIRGIATGVLDAKQLVLLASAGIRDQDKAKKLVLKSIAKTGKVATFWLPQKTKKSLQKKLYGVAGSDMLVAPHLKETFKKTVSQDVQADATKITVPTLLIYGDADKATPKEYGRIYEKLIPGSKLVILSGGHFIHHDAADEVVAAIEEFLS